MNLIKRGLRTRGLGEEELLVPFDAILETGITHADRQISFMQGRQITKLHGKNLSDFFEAFLCIDEHVQSPISVPSRTLRNMAVYGL